MGDINEAARGRWPDILASLAGLTDQQLTDRHQPCPLCGGEDRYRFDDQDGSGSWFCNRCGGKNQTGGAGNGMDLLMRRTGWEFKRAAQEVERHLGLPTKKPLDITPRAQGFLSPATIPAPPVRGCEAHWRYSDTFVVARFPGKKIRPLWFDGSAWQWKAPPAPRPLLNLAGLAGRPDASVLVVEGEKTWDAAVRLFPTAVAITWASGCKAIDKSDWSALQGRKVVLWPDHDTPGVQAMNQLAQRLLRLGAESVRIAANPPDATEGWDLADATWTPQEAAAYVKANLSEPVQLLAEPEPTLPSPEPPPIEIRGNAHFECLGFDGDVYYYQPRMTGQVMRLSRSAHSSTSLVALAPLPYWETLYPSKTGVNWTAAAASLFQQCAAAGVYSPERIRGRGAYLDGRHVVLHLGDRLLIDGAEHSVMEPLPYKSRFVYQRAQLLDGHSNLAPLGDDESLPLLELAERFRWEVPASGLLLAGWVTLAPICGALDWRPHAWLTGGAGAGKSAILERYVMPLLGDMVLPVASNTTEAGLRQTLRSDALPVVFDEAESNEKTDHSRMQAILSLARVASSETRAHLIKGSPSGEVTRFHIRSMFFLSSISTALKQGADKSRFAQLILRSNSDQPQAERTTHWDELDRDLDRYITPEVAQRLIARTISLIPTIRQSARVFSRVAGQHFDSQRLGDQYGALLAGAWSLMTTSVPTDREALALIEQNNWEPYSEATEVPDERRCIDHVMQTQLRVDATNSQGHVATQTRTLRELVDHLVAPEVGLHLDAENTLGRHGIRVDMADGRATVLVSNTAKALSSILADTAWAHSWGTVLARLPGARKAGSVYFKGLGTNCRAIALPLESI